MVNLKSLFLAGLSSLMLVGCCTTHRTAQNWEYKVEEMNLYENAQGNTVEKRINQLTAEGWQFVSASPRYAGESSVSKAMLIMKRPRK